MNQNNININDLRIIKKYFFIKEKDKKCYLAYVCKRNDDFIIGYRLCKNRFVPFFTELNNITFLKPYNSCGPDNCDLGLNSIILLACI